jgi:deaminated glutathione amidase
VGTVRVAVVQVPSVREGVVELVEPLVGAAAESRADLVVLPEGVMHDFHPSVDLATVAEPLDGPFATAVRSMAARHSVGVVAGMWERDPEDPRPWNTLLMVDRAGQDLATYRKIHLFDSFGWKESERVIPGPPGPTCVPFGGMTLGLMTCYDLRFPELARASTAAGADVLLFPAGWVAGPGKLHHWETLLTARAIENTSYVVAADLCGTGYTGHSRIIDPMGEAVASLDEEPGFAVGDLDADRIAEVRKLIPSLEHRRM